MTALDWSVLAVMAAAVEPMSNGAMAASATAATCPVEAGALESAP